MCETLPQFTNDNTMVKRYVTKGSFMVSARESIEKTCYFSCQRALAGLDEASAAAELSNGNREDLY